MIDFAQLPPEINSALMYSGPGSGLMLAAGTAWEGLAAELEASASAYAALVNDLTDGPWQGPSSAAMVTAAVPQISWLSGTAAQAEEAASQAAAAASAYETAFALTVPPPVIAANRALLSVLLATNALGQNTAAIAATEAHYAEMWAQDAAAMYGYAGASAAASTLTPFTPTSRATNPAGVANQAAAAGQAVATSAGANTNTLQLIPNTLQGLAGITSAPPGLTDFNGLLKGLGLSLTPTPGGSGVVVGGIAGDLLKGLTGSSTLNAATPFEAFIRGVAPTRLFATTFRDIDGLQRLFFPAAKAAEAAGAAAAAGAAKAAEGVAGAGLRGITGAVGNALPIAGLRVPAGWVGASNPALLPLNGVGAAAAAKPASNAFGGMPLMSTGGTRSAAGNLAALRYGIKPTVVAQPPAGG